MLRVSGGAGGERSAAPASRVRVWWFVGEQQRPSGRSATGGALHTRGAERHERHTYGWPIDA